MITTTIIYTIISLCVIGIAAAVILYLVAQKFKVEEDPRIDIVESILPGAVVENRDVEDLQRRP